jgi:hypothetical protein
MTAYRWRDDDQAFAKDWEAAKAAGLDALEDEALRRAYEGYDKPIVHQGIITDTVKEYSDTLAIFLLKGGKPEKYRDNARMELTGANGGPLVIDDAARAARVAALLKKAGERKDLDDLV